MSWNSLPNSLRESACDDNISDDCFKHSLKTFIFGGYWRTERSRGVYDSALYKSTFTYLLTYLYDCGYSVQMLFKESKWNSIFCYFSISFFIIVISYLKLLDPETGLQAPPTLFLLFLLLSDFFGYPISRSSTDRYETFHTH